MSDTLIGGLIALAGTMLGFLGVLAVRALDIRRQEREAKRELAGYIGMVITELAMNHTILTHVMSHKIAEAELTISDVAYRPAELLLSRELSWKAQEELYKAYAPIRSGLLYSWLFVSAGGSFEVERHRRIDFEACGALLPQLERAAAELRKERARLTPSFPPET